MRRRYTAHLLAPGRVGDAHGPAGHDGTIIPDTVDMMGGSDANSCLTRVARTATIFIAVDHCTAECVGIRAANLGTRFEALGPLRQGVRHAFGGYWAGIAADPSVGHDDGSQCMSDHFQDELRFLGIAAFVREPGGNGCGERFIRTLKGQLLWLRTFDTVEELRLALLAFKERYNRARLIERHGHQTPAAKRAAVTTASRVAA